MTRIDRIAKAYGKFARWVAVVSGVVVMLMMLYTTADVIGRYGFNHPVPGAFEYTNMFLIFVTYFGITLVQSRGAHLRLAMLWEKVGPRGKAIIDLMSVIIGLFIFTIITWQGWLWAVQSWQTREEIMGVYNVLLFPARFGLAIGASIFVIQYVIDIFRFGAVLATGEKRGVYES